MKTRLAILFKQVVWARLELRPSPFHLLTTVAATLSGAAVVVAARSAVATTAV
jgi:hypothetical protein